MHEGAEFLRRWCDEVWNKGRDAAIDEMMALDCIAHGLNDEHGHSIRGPEPFRKFYRAFRPQFASIKVHVQDFRIYDDRTAARILVEGMHAASGKPVSFAGEVIVRLKDGRAVEAWNNFDFHIMDQQLRY